MIPSAKTAYRSAYAAFSDEDLVFSASSSLLFELERMDWSGSIAWDRSVTSIGGMIAEARLASKPALSPSWVRVSLRESLRVESIRVDMALRLLTVYHKMSRCILSAPLVLLKSAS